MKAFIACCGLDNIIHDARIAPVGLILEYIYAAKVNFAG